MKKIYRITLLLIFLFFTSVMYLTFVGVETERFNKQIYNKINDLNQDIKVDLKKLN